jgi:hypothetical protein
MTTFYDQLGKRTEAQSHDLTNGDPDSTSLPGKEVARRARLRFMVEVPTAAEAAAADVIGEKPILAVPASQFPNGAKLVEVQFRSDTAITESTSVYATDTFTSRDSLGVSNLTAATLKTDTIANGGIGTTVAQKKYVATLSATAANRVIPADGCLTLTRAKASTGTQLPDCHYEIVLEAL